LADISKIINVEKQSLATSLAPKLNVSILDIVRSSLANGDPVIFYLDSTCSWMFFQWERCSKWLTVTPFVLRRAQVKKKNIFSKMDFNHEIR